MPQRGARWRTICRKCALSSVVTTLSLSSLWGQSTTQGVVGGVVTASGGAALVDAEVDLTSADTAHVYQARTDAQGNFRFLGLPPGSYEAWITQSGFARLHIASVPVEVGRFTPLPAHLTIARVKETIEVREPGAVLDLSSPALSTNIDEISIDELPSNSTALELPARRAHSDGRELWRLKLRRRSRHRRCAHRPLEHLPHSQPHARAPHPVRPRLRI
jgi:hypothetical protein